MNNSPIRVLSKTSRSKKTSIPHESIEGSSSIADPEPLCGTVDLSAFQLKHESQARTFKLIDEKDWNIIDCEPDSEKQFFSDGNPLMSVISAIGTAGAGKSSLLNKIAHKYAFETHHNSMNQGSPSKNYTRHLTKGVDIHVTHHRILLDCQPLLSHSVLDDFLSGQSGSQFGRDHAINDALTCSHMISLQLTAFLMAICDFVVIMNKWLIDGSLMQLISSALMMLGEGNYKAKIIMFCEDDSISERKFKDLTNSCLGMNQVDRYFSDERDLINYISSYSGAKCDQLEKDPAGLRGKKWLAYSKKLWSTTFKDSSLFADYALQLHRTNNPSLS